MADRPVTLIEAVHERTGSWLRTGQIVAFIEAWRVVRDVLGREPTMTEYIAHWRQPDRSAWREQARFREAFPEHETPSTVLDAAVPPAEVSPALRRPRPA